MSVEDNIPQGYNVYDGTTPQGDEAKYLVPTHETAMSMVSLRCEAIGEKPWGFHDGYIALGMSMGEVIRLGIERGFVVYPVKDTPEIHLRNPNWVGRLHYTTPGKLFIIGENPLASKDDTSVYVPDFHLHHVVASFIPPEERLWIL